MVFKLADHKIVDESREQKMENFSRFKDTDEAAMWGEWARLQKGLFKKPPSEAIHEALRTFKERGVKDILVVGCGSGKEVVFLAEEIKGAKVTGLDSSKEALAVLEKTIEDKRLGNVRVVHGSATQIEDKDGSHSGALAHLVLEMLNPSDRKDAVSEMGRILKPGGVAVVASFFSESEMGELIKSFENNKLKPFELITNPEKTFWVLKAEKEK